jgi:hypothetical protein
MVQFSQSNGISNADPDTLYYNAMIINNTTVTTDLENDPAINYQDTRALPLLKDKSKYDVGIENFVINGCGKSLPILIPQIKPGANQGGTNTNPDNTVYSVTFTWTDGTNPYQSTRFIQWEPENQASFTVVPVGTYLGPQISSDYYYCYSYSHWLKLMNSALAMAWGDVKFWVEDDGYTIGTKCPFFTYDQVTNLFSLYQDANTCLAPFGSTLGQTPGPATPADPPSPYTIFGSAAADASYANGEYSFVGFNTNFEGLISNFNTKYYGAGVLYANSGVRMRSAQGTASNSTVTKTTQRLNYPENVVIVVAVPDPTGTELTNPVTLSSAFGSVTTAPTSDPLYYIVTQDFQSTSTLWSPVATINVLTTFIAVREEYAGTPITLGTGNLGGNATTGSFQKAIIEVPIDVDTQEGWRGLLTYTPQVERSSSLSRSKEELKNLNIQLYWRNRLTNELLPLLLYNGGSMTMRLKYKRIAE